MIYRSPAWSHADGDNVSFMFAVHPANIKIFLAYACVLRESDDRAVKEKKCFRC